MTRGDEPWIVRSEGDRVPSGEGPEWGGDGNSYANQTADAANNSGNKKGASPEYWPPALGVPLDNQAYRRGGGGGRDGDVTAVEAGPRTQDIGMMIEKGKIPEYAGPTPGEGLVRGGRT